jgi:GMP synthase (glutamine-hydrolysing)
VQWNYDVVVELPPGAEALARTAAGELQVARYGPTAWGVQLHPEVDEVIVGTWVTDSERGELADRGLDADALLAEIKEAREELDHAWAPLAAGFADVALGTVS